MGSIDHFTVRSIILFSALAKKSETLYIARGPLDANFSIDFSDPMLYWTATAICPMELLLYIQSALALAYIFFQVCNIRERAHVASSN